MSNESDSHEGHTDSQIVSVSRADIVPTRLDKIRAQNAEVAKQRGLITRIMDRIRGIPIDKELENKANKIANMRPQDRFLALKDEMYNPRATESELDFWRQQVKRYHDDNPRPQQVPDGRRKSSYFVDEVKKREDRQSQWLGEVNDSNSRRIKWEKDSAPEITNQKGRRSTIGTEVVTVEVPSYWRDLSERDKRAVISHVHSLEKNIVKDIRPYVAFAKQHMNDLWFVQEKSRLGMD